MNKATPHPISPRQIPFRLTDPRCVTLSCGQRTSCFSSRIKHTKNRAPNHRDRESTSYNRAATLYSTPLYNGNRTLRFNLPAAAHSSHSIFCTRLSKSVLPRIQGTILAVHDRSDVSLIYFFILVVPSPSALLFFYMYQVYRIIRWMNEPIHARFRCD